MSDTYYPTEVKVSMERHRLLRYWSAGLRYILVFAPAAAVCLVMLVLAATIPARR